MKYASCYIGYTNWPSSVVNEMSRLQYVVLCVVLASASTFTLTAAGVAPLPKCAPQDFGCAERLMHPDLSDEPMASPQQPQRRMIDGENTNDYWRNHGKEFVREKLTSTLNTKRAKNVILFLGDGMGLATVSAARTLLGGEESQMSFEKFPYTGFSKTYSIDRIVSDSACTATAYLCGIKANEGTAGVNGNVNRGDCKNILNEDNFVYSIAKWAMDAGKWAGFATTTRVTHASPSGVYAHIAERDWEDDTWVSDSCGANSGIPDIAYQLIHGSVGQRLKLMMGGGRRYFCDQSICANGTRADGHNLIQDFRSENPRNVYLETRDDLMNADLTSAERILGLYQDNHLLYHLETDERSNQPTLEEMTRKAIEVMSRNEQGYFMFIEGGRIDLAHHDNQARIALDEAVEFSKAIAAAHELTDPEDTLIVVTADHSHAFSFSGYPYRGNDIFGTAPATPLDDKPYLTLSYANGPAYEKYFDAEHMQRVDPTSVVNGDAHDMFPAAVPLDSETHGGEDVPVYARGPWAHLFTGTYEQNAIPHIMAYAACIGDGLKSCNN